MAIHINNPPEAKPERISRLVTRLEQGDVKIPVFQRRYVWRSNQVLELLDSIYRGYPIGSLLFWLSKESLATERDIGEFTLPPTPEHYPRNYVLDGQQRLTSIYGVLRWNGAPEEDHVFNISFDLTNQEFVKTENPPRPTHIPMNIIFDSRRLREFQSTLLPRPDGQALLDASDVISETFREYSIPVVTVTEATVEHVASIFERINSTGTTLTVYDLMVAATWSASFDLRQQVDSTLDDMSDKDFANVSPVTVLQVLAAHVAGSAKRASIIGLRSQDVPSLTAKVAEVREALKKAVDFLVTEVEVKSAHFLPYERQLVALGFAYAKRGALSRDDVEVLRKWFWRTSFSERYRRGGEGLFDDDLNNVITLLSDSSILETLGTLPTPIVLRRNQFRRNSALSNAFVALLATNRPRSLWNGSRIDTGKALSSYNRKEFHHIFPQAFLKTQGVSLQKISSLANMCMLSAEHNKVISDSPPSKYFATLRNQLGSDFIPVLESNLIPEAAVDSLMSDDLDEFLAIRADHIAETVARVTT